MGHDARAIKTHARNVYTELRDRAVQLVQLVSQKLLAHPPELLAATACLIVAGLDLVEGGAIISFGRHAKQNFLHVYYIGCT